MKIRPTPESAEVVAIRQQYDREVYELREEIATLRAELAAGRPTKLFALIAAMGIAIGALAAWLVLA